MNTTENIFIIKPDGNQLSINIDLNETVGDLKKKIQAEEGTPVTQQALAFSGKLLEDDQQLVDYNIEKEGTLHLAVQVKGGRNPLFAFFRFVIYAGTTAGSCMDN